MVRAIDAFTALGTWQAPPLEHRNGEILRYIVNITHTTSGRSQTFITPNTSLTTGSLHPHYPYFYNVLAENVVGRGPHSTAIIRMPEAGKMAMGPT